eukprot:TRINITY_DN9024_c0_g1_i3.p1 TRINITY_DN9024_c0_g1~~TRINITY_DN9024_c0_g1_i3.p1  ORF type:complete len:669 (+),score=120.98 TRINITY_DN9024_c0_g1_i3:207-2213(+)
MSVRSLKAVRPPRNSRVSRHSFLISPDANPTLISPKVVHVSSGVSSADVVPNSWGCSTCCGLCVPTHVVPLTPQPVEHPTPTGAASPLTPIASPSTSGTLHPRQWASFRGGLYGWWTLLMLLLTLYHAIAILTRLAFFTPAHATIVQNWLVVDYVLDGLFLVDMYLHARVFSIEIAGREIFDHEAIARQYKSDRVRIDVVASLPADLLVLGAAPSQTVLLAMALRLTKLIRLYYVPRYSKTLQSFLLRLRLSFCNADVILYGKFVLLFLFMSQVLACVWYVCGAHIQPAHSWIEADKNLNTLLSQYFRAIYYLVACLATLSYGDIGPVTEVETVAVCVFVLLGAGWWAGLAGAVESAVIKSSRHESHQQHTHNQIQQFLTARRLPGDLKQRLSLYFHLLHSRAHGVDEDDMMGMLSPNLQLELAYLQRRRVLEHFPIFQSCSLGFLKHLAHSLQLEAYLADECLYEIGDAAEKLFFIEQGSVLLTDADTRTVALLIPGNFFGEELLLEGLVQAESMGQVCYRRVTARATVDCQVYVLTRSNVVALLALYPHYQRVWLNAFASASSLSPKRGSDSPKRNASWVPETPSPVFGNTSQKNSGELRTTHEVDFDRELMMIPEKKDEWTLDMSATSESKHPEIELTRTLDQRYDDHSKDDEVTRLIREEYEDM